jgi:hypothetical protein
MALLVCANAGTGFLNNERYWEGIVIVMLTTGWFTGQDIYFYQNHMIKYVRLTGVIVAAEENFGRMFYTLDDSSGVNIEVTCAAPPRPSLDEGGNAAAPNVAAPTTKPASGPAPVEPAAAKRQECISPDGPNLTDIDVGSVVKVKGGIGIFRGQKQIRLKIITIIGDTNAEIKCWNDMMEFRRDILNKPWVVTAEEEEKCRLEVDREARWRIEEEAKRKKDQLRRHLKQREKELRKEQRKGKEEEENSKDGYEVVKKRKVKDKQSEGLDPVNRVNYPSKAARRRAAGKYDALGI